MVALLSGCIPDLQLHVLVINHDGFGFEVNADRGDVSGLENVLNELEEYVGLPHRAVADDKDFDGLRSHQ